MQLSEFYRGIGGSYDDVITRLRSDRLILRFLEKFADDPSFEELCSFFEAGMPGEAFCRAHTLKGICMNLGFGDMGDTVARITELLRPGDDTVDKARVRAEMETLKVQYAAIISGIAQLK